MSLQDLKPKDIGELLHLNLPVVVCTERGMLAATTGVRLPRADVAAGQPTDQQ